MGLSSQKGFGGDIPGGSREKHTASALTGGTVKLEHSAFSMSWLCGTGTDPDFSSVFASTCVKWKEGGPGASHLGANTYCVLVCQCLGLEWNWWNAGQARIRYWVPSPVPLNR